MIVQQIAFLLAKSNHQVVEKLFHDIESGIVDEFNFDAKLLRKNKVLDGIKVLDLGCSSEPTFARCARSLGAEVFTVDMIPADEFRIWQPGREIDGVIDGVREEMRSFEELQHVIVDLNNTNVFNLIAERTGSQFDVITAAHLRTGDSYNGRVYNSPSINGVRDLAMKLLKDGGAYFNPLGVEQFNNETVIIK